MPQNKKIFLTIAMIVFLLSPILANAQCFDENGEPLSVKECQEQNLGDIGVYSGYSSGGVDDSPDLATKVGQIISYVLAFLGVIFLVIVVQSGIQWMTAGGNPETVKKARDKLVNAAVGLAIVLAAYAITYFVVGKLQETVLPATSNNMSCEDHSDEEFIFSCIPMGTCSGIEMPGAEFDCPSAGICCKTQITP